MSFTLLTLVFGFVILSSAYPAPEAKGLLDSNDIKGKLDTGKGQEMFPIESYQSPPEVAKLFPYYLTGYDEEDRPIGVIDLGKWDARSWAKKGKEAWDDLERHAEKMLYILKAGVHAKNFTDESNVTRTVTDELGLIVDFDGFSVAQATNPKVVTFLTKFLGKLQLIQHRLSYAYFINVNAVASALVRLLRPALGSAFERIEVYGTRTSDWIPVLRRNLPADALPEKYGGKAGHKPLVFYG
ncbi:unnamed protein product [Allacma fusca]|uniref:CRAL-TRIO domain-containing protein n=1 Tax=Allacma fusca TaxID=39272 RepID=A0A8J2JBC7_9HEXA|nr:unnamed protein product [Allacma fusca]